MADVFAFVDDLGPARVIHVHEPSAGLRAVLVVDNVARGPSIGGVRMATDVTLEECIRLARAMTLKNAAAGLPHGGGKVVLYGNPRTPEPDKELLIRALSCALRDERAYIFGPDMGTDETCMAWVKDEIDRAVGLPRALGGIPLDEIGATGWGISHVTEVALRFCDFDLEGARLVVQGFGAVGRHSVRYLARKGAVLVGAADSSSTIYDARGLDVETLIALKRQGAGVSDYPGGERLARDAVIDLDCDIWIPAARPDVVTGSNAHRLQTRLVVEGANIPLTQEAEVMLYQRGVVCVPDFIANAGGVICGAMEYRGASEAATFDAIEGQLRRNTEEVLETALREGKPPRVAAVELATRRVKTAMGLRRWSLY